MRAEAHRRSAHHGGAPRRLTILPSTRSGSWAVGLTLAAVLTMLAWKVMPGGGATGLALALAGGGFALHAVVARGERALSVLVALLPFALAVAFLVAEIVEIVSGG